MNENMNEKYQQYYNKLLTGTLTDTMLKSISFQANIQLANDIIAENEKTIESLNKELEELKTNKNVSENTKISNLETQVKSHTATISHLQADLFEANKLRNEYENVKHQVQHLDTFRNDLVKAREEIKNLQIQHNTKVEDLKKSYESKITELNLTIDNLKTPTKKKATKVNKVVSINKVAPIKTIGVEEIKDGGSF